MPRTELFGGGLSCSLRDGLAKDGSAAGLNPHCAHAILVVTPDVAIVEPFRTEIAGVHLLAGADVVAECSDQVLQCAAVAETSPSPSPYCVMREYAFTAVVIDQPDLAACVDLHAGVAIYLLAVEETAAMVGDDVDDLVDLLAAFTFHPSAVFRIAAAAILRFRLVIGGADHTGQ